MHHRTEYYEAFGSSSTLEQNQAPFTGWRVPNSPLFIITCTLAVSTKLKQIEKKEVRSLERKVDKGIDNAIDDAENSFRKTKNAVNSGYKYSEIK